MGIQQQKNVHYHYTVNCRASISSVTSQINSSATPGIDATRPAVATTAQLSPEVPIVAPADKPQKAHVVSPNITTSPVVTSEIPSVHSVHSGSQKNGSGTLNKQAPVCFSGGYISMSGILSTDESLSHSPCF